MPHPLTDILKFLRELAPVDLAETWDNVGLLIGDERQHVQRILTCLTLTSDVADEALSRHADLIVTHHPVLFRPVQRLVAGHAQGEMLLRLIRGGVAVYSPHTAFDSALHGINQQLTSGLGLEEIRVLRPSSNSELGGLGAGRHGKLREPMKLADFVELVRTQLKVRLLQYVGNPGRLVSRVAVACGSGGEFLSDAFQAGCDVLLTGETRFHTCLEARDMGVALVLPGHYATERPGVERLAVVLHREFQDVEVWASEREADPLSWSTH